jgi:SAM-dependent methyltransferase
VSPKAPLTSDTTVRSTADAVRKFYDEHPYPPPETDLDSYKKRWRNLDRRRADFHLRWPTRTFREDHTVLVAGCGTSQAAKYALRWPEARVTGIDISAASIRCTEKLKRKYKLDNLELHQIPVDAAADLGHQFEEIVCTGVLHHLPNPDAGLRALRDVLAPSGALNVMVYAPYGRACIYLLQDYCRRLGIGTSAAEIRDLAASLRALPQEHPIVPLLRNSPDFRSDAGIADALLHPQDRSYSVPELFEFIGNNGLRFGRWQRQAPYLPHCGAILTSPHQPLLARLPIEEQFAALELFRGTMLRHSAILYRDDHPGEPQPVRFDTDNYLQYTPIRLPNTICVEERLPPSAAGVLIYRGHTYNDIYLPIDPGQKQMFEAIDGERTIEQIAHSESARASARVFFERLWRYDQIVISAPAVAIGTPESARP